MRAAAAGPLIEWLGRASGGPETLGGKAASLDRLARMGFLIPPGFCLTTEAFRRQLRRNGGESDVDADRKATAAALVTEPLEADLAHALGLAVDRLTADTPGAASLEPEFAVRSSAVGEDGAAASYAGLHETELGVRPEGVNAAVRRCWASLWSPEALAYRQY